MPPEPTGPSESEGRWPRPREAQDELFNSPRRWAGRLAFPLLAAAVLLAWRGVGVESEEASTFPRWGWWMVAALAAFAGLLLMRIRHRRP